VERQVFQRLDFIANAPSFTIRKPKSSHTTPVQYRARKQAAVSSMSRLLTRAVAAPVSQCCVV